MRSAEIHRHKRLKTHKTKVETVVYKLKTSKVKKAQTKQYETLRKITKITTEFILSWPSAAGLPWWDSLGETKFSFVSNCLLEATSWRGMGDKVHFSSLLWDPVWFGPEPVLFWKVFPHCHLAPLVSLCIAPDLPGGMWWRRPVQNKADFLWWHRYFIVVT